MFEITDFPEEWVHGNILSCWWASGTRQSRKYSKVLWLQMNDIIYEKTDFQEEWVHGKIKVIGWRPELASPISIVKFYGFR